MASVRPRGDRVFDLRQCTFPDGPDSQVRNASPVEGARIVTAHEGRRPPSSRVQSTDCLFCSVGLVAKRLHRQDSAGQVQSGVGEQIGAEKETAASSALVGANEDQPAGSQESETGQSGAVILFDRGYEPPVEQDVDWHQPGEGNQKEPTFAGCACNEPGRGREHQQAHQRCRDEPRIVPRTPTRENVPPVVAGNCVRRQDSLHCANHFRAVHVLLARFVRTLQPLRQRRPVVPFADRPRAGQQQNEGRRRSEGKQERHLERSVDGRRRMCHPDSEAERWRRQGKFGMGEHRTAPQKSRKRNAPAEREIEAGR